MTQVRIGITAPTSDGTGRRPTGTLFWRPSKRRVVDDDFVMPSEFSVRIGADPAPTIEVAPSGPDWAWVVKEAIAGGSPHLRYVAVPDSATVVDYADLIAVDPATLDPLEVPEAAWWAALAALPTGGGGVSVVDHGDGTFDLSGSSVTDNGDGTYSIAA